MDDAFSVVAGETLASSLSGVPGPIIFGLWALGMIIAFILAWPILIAPGIKLLMGKDPTEPFL